jgi:hypothetical protein
VKVIQLKTVAVMDREAIEKITAALSQKAEGGKIRSLLVFYLDEENTPYLLESQGMTLANMAYAVECIRRRLQAWMDA